MMLKSVPRPELACQIEMPATARKRITVTSPRAGVRTKTRTMDTRICASGDFVASLSPGPGMHDALAEIQAKGSRPGGSLLARFASKASMAQKAEQCSSQIKKTDVEANMQNHCTEGNAQVAPSRKETSEVILVSVIETPTLSMAFSTRIGMLKEVSVASKAPAITKASSMPIPTRMKGRICVSTVNGTPSSMAVPKPATMPIRTRKNSMVPKSLRLSVQLQGFPRNKAQNTDISTKAKAKSGMSALTVRFSSSSREVGTWTKTSTKS
mmetsp:Transcript_42520/g.101341  ORF Transcript_42520/g.101341 Transcript_42520/m.101341 type:complete len:268 (+) Transcript_42520:1311-2114(+)